MIDLEEIGKTNNLIKSRCNDIEKYGKIGVPGKDDVCIRYMQAKQIATALEQLPKLVTALRGAIEIAAPVDASEVEQLDFAKQALEPFTENQPQP